MHLTLNSHNLGYLEICVYTFYLLRMSEPARSHDWVLCWETDQCDLHQECPSDHTMLAHFHCCTHVHTNAQFCHCFVILSHSRRPFDQCSVVVVTDPETKHSNSITVGNPIHHSPLI